MNGQELIRAEFHCHTVFSHDSSNRLQQLLQAAEERGIRRLAITDHNTIQGALLAKEMDPERVVVGEEILTDRGELLAYFLNEAVPGDHLIVRTIEKKEKLKVSVFDPARERNCTLAEIILFQ